MYDNLSKPTSLRKFTIFINFLTLKVVKLDKYNEDRFVGLASAPDILYSVFTNPLFVYMCVIFTPRNEIQFLRVLSYFEYCAYIYPFKRIYHGYTWGGGRSSLNN